MKTLGWLAPLSTAGQPISVNQTGFDCGTQAVGVADLGAAGTVEVLAAPPGLQVLEAEDPRLAGAVGDGRADLRVAVGAAGVVPVEAFAAGDVGFEIVEIVDGARAGESIGVLAAVAPIGERPVEIDADGIDGR